MATDECPPVSKSLSSITGDEVKGAQDQPDAQTAIELSRAHLEGLRQDIGERKKYAHRIFVLICFWLAAVFLLLVADGLSNIDLFVLPEGVILAIIGSTTLNVLGIFYIVTHYLFPKR